MKAAFTLIEVLAAVFLTAVVMSVAISFFVNLSDSTDAAAQKTREGRQALAVLDRVARDLEGAYLVSKPPALDPLSHPWSFIAESELGDSASDRVRFVSRSHRPRNRLDHGSDLATVNYILDPAEDAPGFNLLRSVSPGLPSEEDVGFSPGSGDDFMVVAESVRHFGLYFMSRDLEWHEVWDSTQLEQSSALPRAAKIEIAYLPKDASEVDDFDDFGLGDFGEEETRVYARQIRLPMEPVDLAEILASASKGEDGVAEEEEGDDEDEEDFGDDEPEQPGDSLGQQSDLPEDLDALDLLKDIRSLGLPDDFDPSLLEQLIP
ncbi:MAG: hypothetical protein VX466_00265 [Myxococcota bacterium]|nr:hypothetical protein [Myxococcota bacterium]